MFTGIGISTSAPSAAAASGADVTPGTRRILNDVGSVLLADVGINLIYAPDPVAVTRRFLHEAGGLLLSAPGEYLRYS